MGDEAQAAAIPAPSQLFEHYCEEPDCKAWGALGHEPIKGLHSYWCWDHLPDEEWKAERRKERMAASGN